MSKKLASTLSKGAWQPIKSCPTNKDVLVCVTYSLGDGEWETIQWVDSWSKEYPWTIYETRIDIPLPPTHWMPLPPSPFYSKRSGSPNV